MFVGPSSSLALALTMVTENIVIIPLALTLAESDRHAGKSLPQIFVHLVGSWYASGVGRRGFASRVLTISEILFEP